VSSFQRRDPLLLPLVFQQKLPLTADVKGRRQHAFGCSAGRCCDFSRIQDLRMRQRSAHIHLSCNAIRPANMALVNPHCFAKSDTLVDLQSDPKVTNTKSFLLYEQWLCSAPDTDDSLAVPETYCIRSGETSREQRHSKPSFQAYSRVFS
jgi:hypothetical protein